MADPKSEVEELMNEMLPFAEQMLQQHGEFIPYGAAMKPSGEIVSVAGEDGNEMPKSQDIIDLLKSGFRDAALSGDYTATAIFYDVRVTLPDSEQLSDAIAVALDHKENYSVVVLFPYRLEDSEIEFGQVFTNQGDYDIFRD